MFIRAAVHRETKTASLDDLDVHTTAMFLLASSAIDVTADTIPETLTFDVNRIAEVQREYRRIVKGCAALVTARHELGTTMLPMQRDVLTKLTALVIDGGDVAVMFPSILDDADNIIPSAAVRQTIINPSAAMLQLMYAPPPPSASASAR
jgi:hypothetical protein